MRATLIDPEAHLGLPFGMTTHTPTETTRLFLESMALRDTDVAVDLIADDIVYTNVSLPTLHGKAKTAKVVRSLNNPRYGFGVRLINVAADGNVVLTERIDELTLGPLRTQFWVCGRFEIRDGRIVVWRDYFDWFDILKAQVRGLLALAMPRLQTPLPQPIRILRK